MCLTGGRFQATTQVVASQEAWLLSVIPAGVMGMTDLATRLGSVVQARRKAMKLSQEEIAERVGIAAQFLGRIERGESMPSVPTLRLLSDVLGVSCDELLGKTHASARRGLPPVPDDPGVRLLIRRIRRAKPQTVRLLNLFAKALERE
jgi:transcriptional regulator with XRE-family HTH domain